jgi:hypothetical protein
MKLIAYKTTALAFTGALAVASPTRADEMQVSGSQVLTVIDPRMIPGTGEQPRNLGSQIVIGATTSPGWFDSMQASYVETFLGNPKLGQSEEKGYGVWTNSDGTMFNSFAGAATFTMDEKTNAPKGNFKGTWELPAAPATSLASVDTAPMKARSADRTLQIIGAGR